jgi:hypothetical protein
VGPHRRHRQDLEVNGVTFTVVGVFTDEEALTSCAALHPITTSQLAFNGADRINMMMFTVGDKNVERPPRWSTR